MERNVFIRQEVVDSILSYALMNHPKESILLLRGKAKEDRITIDSVVIPPFSVHGEAFSSFPLHMLPIDFSILGIAHSHPSGILRPSIEDLNNFYGRVMIITAYPYLSERDLAVINREGKSLKFEKST